MSFVITADSVPVLDDYGWSDYWTVNDWMNWHLQNVSQYGTVVANSRFKENWILQDSLANPYNWGKYDNDFRTYLNQYGLLEFISNPIADLVSGTSDLVSGVGSGFSNIGGVVNNTTSAANDLTKYLNWFLPAILVLGIIYLFLKFKKK